MRFCAGQARAEFTLFSWFRATSGAPNRERVFLFDLHGYTMHGCVPRKWSIVTIVQNSFGAS
jgi:hypothetical protein